MKKCFYVFVIVLAFIASAKAETGKITISGMHCGGCKKMITKSVCEDKALAETFSSCEVTSLDTKTQIGVLTVTTKKNAPVDLTAIEKAVLATGESYKVSKKEIFK